MENNLPIPQNAKHKELPYDLAIPLLDICPRELKIDIHTKPYTQTFTAVPFIREKIK